MQESPITLKSLLFTLLASSCILLTIFAIKINDRRTKIVFCDVGQGDAAYIRLQNRVDILVDAGPNNQALYCLGKHMPFWDRKIELAFITHHDSDHYGGFISIINRYRVDKFISVDSKSLSKTYNQLHVPFEFYFAGDEIKILDSKILFLWPPKGLKSSEDNQHSLVFLFQEKDFKVLFTGDISPMALLKLVQISTKKDLLALKDVDVLKVPHHGSSNGLTANFLELADPDVAVISVGLNNPYGHPRKEILDLLKAKNIQIKRTDKEGDVRFILEE